VDDQLGLFAKMLRTFMGWRGLYDVLTIIMDLLPQIQRRNVLHVIQMVK
jgi:hypothetical protein